MLATRWCPHTPHPKQAEFLALTCKEALFGGAGGGGKSDALLMDQLQHVGVPGFSGIIFRKTYADLALAGAIMDRSHAWLKPTRAHWDGIKKQWRFPSGARISFGYLATANDRYRYQGAEFQRISFDELTQFTERDYTYLFSRLRAPIGFPVPLAMRAATNPGGLGHAWVKKRFIDEPGDRVFVPSLIADNPSLNANEYRASLAELDSVTRAQMEHGSWLDDTTGLMYRVAESNIHRGHFVRTGDWTFVEAHDYGVTNMNAISMLGWQRHSDVVHVFQSFYVKGLADDVAREHFELQKSFSPERLVGDIGGLGKGFAGELISRHNIPVEAADKANKLGYIKLVNGALERGKLIIHAEGCSDLLAEVSTLQRLPNGKEAPGANHCCDSALVYGFKACRAYMQIPRKPPPTVEQVVAKEAEEARRVLSGKVKRSAWQ